MSEEYGKFQLLKKLATGGMAQIYLARHEGIEGFERLCVVKRILPHLAENQDFVQMFLDEAKIAARLNHPNIVQIYDLGALDDSYFIAMEFIHGEDLRRIWKRADGAGKELPIPFVLRVIADACAGLDYAHKKSENGRPLNIVHRDISPQNVLVTFEGAVKVVDFGIAKAADKMTETRSGVLKGKYSYMSPEQASAREVDARTDIFALGVLLYELLTGTRLFKRNNDVATLRAVTECAVAPPSQVNTRIPGDLDGIVLKALARFPEVRFQQAVELQLALEGWLLDHQLPSSSAYVSSWMRELYGDRLAAEQVAGQPLPDLSESWSAEEEIPPRRRSQSRSARVGSPPEATAEMRPPRQSPVRIPAASLRNPLPDGVAAPIIELPPETAPFQSSVRPEVLRTPRRRHLFAVMLLAMGVGAAGVFLLRERPSTRPALSALTVPASEENTAVEPLPVIPAGQVPAKEPEPELESAKSTMVRLSLRSVPAGAQLFVEGKRHGTAPAELELPAGAVVDVRAELARHEPVVKIVRVGQGPEQAELFSLEKVRPERERDRVRTDPDRAMGTLRFVISPLGTYANIRCNQFDLGEAPGMGDQRIPAGTYDCTFTHPDLGMRRRRVEVRPNALETVKIVFNQD